MLVDPKPQHLVWFDGELVPWRQATMHLSDHHYGVSVFEGVRAYAGEHGPAVFRLRDHTARLLRSAHILNMPVPDRYGLEALEDAQLKVLRANHLANAYLRPFLFYGGLTGLSPRTRGLAVHLAVMAIEWDDSGAFGARDTATRGIALRVSSFARHHPSSVLAKAKANANYINGILALQEAEAAGADDALLLDPSGFVAETSGANVFAVRGGVVLTPPLEHALEGITRDTVITLATARGLRVVERRMSRDDLYVTDEVFLTGTASEITPVREIDGRRVGSGTRGPVTEMLQALYTDHVRGRGERRHEWLTRI
jgi:branched-chain amino acid aminotransferase